MTAPNRIRDFDPATNAIIDNNGDYVHRGILPHIEAIHTSKELLHWEIPLSIGKIGSTLDEAVSKRLKTADFGPLTFGLQLSSCEELSSKARMIS